MKPERVWEELESFESMPSWYGTGHTLVAYEPVVGATVETDAGGPDLRFVGKVLVFDPPHELTFEQDWIGHGWPVPGYHDPPHAVGLGHTRRAVPSRVRTYGRTSVRRCSAASKAAGPTSRSKRCGSVSRASARDAVIVAPRGPDAARDLLELLRDEPGANAGQIVSRFPHINRPAVSKHLRVLREADLVRAEEHGREWKYHVDPYPLADIYYGWLQSFAPMWEESLDRLKRQVEGGPDGRRQDRRRQRRA